MAPLPPPPRRVRRPLTAGRAVGWVCLTASALATLAALVGLANELAWRVLGRDVPAAVTSLHERPDGDGGYTRVARYTFAPAPGDPPRAGSARIEHAAFRKLQEPYFAAAGTIPDDIVCTPDRPVTLTVRAYAVGPVVYARPPSHAHGLFFLLIPLLALVVAIPVTGVLYHGLIGRERARRRLIARGVAVRGKITGRHEERSDESISYSATYAYTPAGASPRTGTLFLDTAAEYDRARPGTAVTVCYDPADPGRSTVYEFGPYRAG